MFNYLVYITFFDHTNFKKTNIFINICFSFYHLCFLMSYCLFLYFNGFYPKFKCLPVCYSDPRQ